MARKTSAGQAQAHMHANRLQLEIARAALGLDKHAASEPTCFAQWPDPARRRAPGEHDALARRDVPRDGSTATAPTHRQGR